MAVRACLAPGLHRRLPAFNRQVQAMHDHAKRTGCCPHWARPGIFMLCRWEVRALTLTLTTDPDPGPNPNPNPGR